MKTSEHSLSVPSGGRDVARLILHRSLWASVMLVTAGFALVEGGLIPARMAESPWFGIVFGSLFPITGVGIAIMVIRQARR